MRKIKVLKRPKLLVSFSGGRTSAYMLWWILNCWTEREKWDILVVFANTGLESEETLLFVDECAAAWGVEIVWVEGYANPIGKGWSVVPKIITFETAARQGEPFESFIARLGIPGPNAPWCSDQLKTRAINAYLKSIGWRGFYKAIGVRLDEADRVRDNWEKQRLWYPLFFDNPKRKGEIISWWRDESDFDLQIHEDEGNCVTCWKKPFTQLHRIARRNEKRFDFMKRMQEKHGNLNPRNTKLQPPYNFFRGNKSVEQVVADAFSDNIDPEFFIKDAKCAQSCEAY